MNRSFRQKSLISIISLGIIAFFLVAATPKIETKKGKALERVNAESQLKKKAKKTAKSKKNSKKKKRVVKKKAKSKGLVKNKSLKKQVDRKRIERLKRISRAKNKKKGQSFSSAKVKASKRSKKKALYKVGKPSGKVKLKSTKLKKKKKKNWGISLRYGLSTDFADEVEPRIYSHSMGMSGSYTFFKKYSMSLGFGMRYVSSGGLVRVDDNDRDFSAGFSNVGLNLSFPIWSKKDSISITGSGGFILPTSETAQYEGYKGISSGGISASIPFWSGIYSMSHSLSGSYILNTYEFSPTSENINSDFSASYSLGNSFRLGWGFRFGASFSIYSTHYLDDSWVYSYGNGVSLSYRYKSLSASLRFSNSNYADDPGVTLWFVDQYRQVLRFGMGYSF